MTQRVNKQVGFLPAIEPELHLFEIGCKMFRADVMPSSHYSALEERKGVLDGIGVDVPDNIDLCAVIYRLVLVLVDSGSNHCFGIASPIVSDNPTHVHTDSVLDVLRQGFGFGILYVVEAKITTTLPDADNNFFCRESGFLPPSLFATANVCFIHFDSTIKHGLIDLFHGCTDAVTEIPRRFVGTFMQTPDRALELVSTHAFLGFTKQQRREKPLLQWQMGIVEDRSSRDGELIVAILAVEELLRGLQFDDRHLAARALRAIWPAQPDKNLAAFFVSVKKVDNVD